jgi:hypothetical protein
MPAAAFAESEYLAGTLCGGSRIVASEGEHEHASSPLGHSEVLRVEYPPCHAVPAVGQLGKHDAEVPTAVRGEQPGNVLQEHGSGSNSVNESEGVEVESGALAGESGAASGDADVLAGEPPVDEVGGRGVVKGSYVVMDRHLGPVSGEYRPLVRVGLAHQDRNEPGAV